VSRFIRVKTAEGSQYAGGIYKPEFAHINLDAIVEIKEDPNDTSRCYVALQGREWTQCVFMPAEALILMINNKEVQS